MVEVGRGFGMLKNPTTPFASCLLANFLRYVKELSFKPYIGRNISTQVSRNQYFTFETPLQCGAQEKHIKGCPKKRLQM